MACIYKITNLINGKFYIGSTIRPFYIRKYEHKRELRLNTHSNNYLQNSWNKYGESSFKFEVLEKIENEEYNKKEFYRKLIRKEAEYIENYKPHYNTKSKITEGKIGWVTSEEVKKKISESNKNRFKDKQLKQSTLDNRERESRRINGILLPKKNTLDRKLEKEERKKLRERKKQLESEKVVSKMIIINGKRKHSPEAVAKIQQRSRQEDNKNRILEIQKIAANKRIGLHHKKESKLASNLTKFGKIRKIEMYNKTNNLLHTFDLSLEAAQFLGIKRSAISNNLCGISKTCGGYIFKYKEIENEFMDR